MTTCDLGHIDINALIKVRFNGQILETSCGRLILNEILPDTFGYVNEALTKKMIGKMMERIYHQYGIDRAAQFADDLKDLGFTYAQRAGFTFALEDIHIPLSKEKILADSTELVRTIERQYQRGLITDEERYAKVVETWMMAQSQMEKDMMAEFPKLNDLYIIMSSGARGNISQMTQVAAMKGMVADPTGAIIELPIRSNFKEGLSVFEYFVSTHGSRKGRADTALRTSEAGYLTRRLVDVSQDVVITVEDCGTKNTRTIEKKFYEEIGENWDKYIMGRVLGKEVAGIKEGTRITEPEIKILNEKGITEIDAYSLISCEAERGVCQKCYGVDLATGHPVKIGTAVGIIAAQAIGEPGTQLTMRTFHTGGAAGEDITQGLPRVEELFEARMPKKPAILSEIAGVASVKKDGDIYRITVVGQGVQTENISLTATYNFIVNDGDKVVKNQVVAEGAKAEVKPIRATATGVIAIHGNKAKISGAGEVAIEYTTAKTTQLLVKNGDQVTKGQQLTEGHFDLALSLKLLGAAKTQSYIIKQVQAIYETQGQDINDKHIEVIIRMMNSKVKVLEGNEKYLPGQIVSRYEVNEKNKGYAAKGEKQVKYEDLIMGITRVALKTESFLSAASFQETTSILIDAAISGKVDYLEGLKENVIIGKLIPAGTGFDVNRDDLPEILDEEETIEAPVEALTE